MGHVAAFQQNLFRIPVPLLHQFRIAWFYMDGLERYQVLEYLFEAELSRWTCSYSVK